MVLPRAFRPSGKLKQIGLSNKGINPISSKRLNVAFRPFRDRDRDGVKNFIDCKPFNPRKQGPFHDLRVRIAEERLERQSRQAGRDNRISSSERTNLQASRDQVQRLKDQGTAIRNREIARANQQATLAEARARTRKARLSSRPQLVVRGAGLIAAAKRAEPGVTQFLTGRKPKKVKAPKKKRKKGKKKGKTRTIIVRV